MSAPVSTPTQITIHPDREVMDVARYPSSATRLAGQRQQFGVSTDTASADFFGKDGFGVMDVVDAINPLNHIPFVSTLWEQVTGHQASTASKLVGGALIGGPIGFLAGLADVIFQQETGHSAGGAVVSALMGSDKAAEATQVASVEATETTEEAAPVAAVITPQAEILPPELPAKISQADVAMKVASITAPARSSADADILSLYGAETKSAHDSYRKAQFQPYLNDVTTSMVI